MHINRVIFTLVEFEGKHFSMFFLNLEEDIAVLYQAIYSFSGTFWS